jgi:hypothetical protein
MDLSLSELQFQALLIWKAYTREGYQLSEISNQEAGRKRASRPILA